MDGGAHAISTPPAALLPPALKRVKTMNHDFDDSLDDLLGGPMAPASARPSVTPPASYKPQHIEACAKCGGRGRFISYAGRDCGPCFACKGAGKKTFAAPAAVRAENREKAAARKASKLEAARADFAAREPAVLAWIEAAAGRTNPFQFAVAMREALAQYGDLTDRQLEACHKLVAQDAARKAERTARDNAAPVADTAGVDRLKAAFDKAAAYAAERGRGLRRPRITIGDTVISPAPAHGNNPGALYVKAGETYLGKIAGGRFYPSRDCSDEMQT